MAEEQSVSIVAWPKEPARVEHGFNAESPCPVAIHFTGQPANVRMVTSPTAPLHVAMTTQLRAEKPIPVCIRVCEPICAESDYRIGLTVFDQPVAQIRVKGRTTLQDCESDKPDVEPELQCADFGELQDGQVFPDAFVHEGVTYEPMGEPIRTGPLGDPVGQTKLLFPPSGLRAKLPADADMVRLTVNNYAGATLLVVLRSDISELFREELPISNEVKTFALEAEGTTVVEVSGGGNEASLVELCYRSSAPVVR